MAATFVLWREGANGVIMRLFVVILFYFFKPLHGESIMGPYDIIFERFEQCEDVGTGELNMWIDKKNVGKGKIVFECNVTLKVPFDDSLMITIDANQVMKDGGLKSLYKKNFVRACYTFGSFLPKLRKQLFNNAGLADRCPVPKGFYIAKDIVFHDSVTQVPVFFYSKYKTEISIKRNNKKIGCNYFYVDIVPKKKGRKRL